MYKLKSTIDHLNRASNSTNPNFSAYYSLPHTLTMNDKVLSHVLLCLFFVLASIIFLIFLKLSYKRNKKNLPPGYMGIPWIGETMEFYKAQRKNELFELFIQPRISKYGKIFKTHLMGSPTVIVNGANANKFFLSNELKGL